jgi:hypothetical protein
MVTWVAEGSHRLAGPGGVNLADVLELARKHVSIAASPAVTLD